MTHGRAAYERGCRCTICRAANTARAARQRARRLARLLSSPVPESDPLHGTATGYNAGCRCEACRMHRQVRYLSREQRPPRRHRWREMVTETYTLARIAWETLRENETHGYLYDRHTQRLTDEHRDFLREHPPPTFQRMLRDLAGIQV